MIDLQPFKFLNSIGLLRPCVYGFKLFFTNPTQLLNELLEDLKKNKNPVNQGIIICFGLPKSGTTMIEEILLINGSIDGSRSLLRKISYLPKNSDPHAFHENLIKFFPQNKSTYLKTHTPYNENYINILKKHNLDYFVSVRDPRQMMLSRYYHIINDPSHRQHNDIIKLDKLEGFKKSLISTNQKEIDPIDEYSHWLKDHIKFSKKIIKYEDFKEDKHLYLKKLAEFSKLKIDPQKTLMFIDKQNPNLKKNLNLKGRKKSTFRKGSSDEWKFFFDNELKTLFKIKFGEVLIQLGYEKKNDW